MRNYKFRGYAVDELASDTQWVLNGYGVAKVEYVDGTNSVHLLTQYGDYLVEEESVGQFTGFNDKNGVDIYEGDVIKLGASESSYVIKYDKGSYVIKAMDKFESTIYKLGDCNMLYISVVGTEYEKINKINEK